MTDFSTVTADHVKSAIEEYDALGPDRFLKYYGFRKTRDYVVWNNGWAYDSKAILGAAQRYASGTAPSANDVMGGKDGAAKVLWDLGFQVVADKSNGSLPEEAVSGPWQEAADVDPTVAADAWAAEAHGILVETAGRYRAVVSYQQLAGLVQLRSGIRTDEPLDDWVEVVLERITRESAARDEPLLSALCVNSHGSVGTVYADWVEAVRGERPADADRHASRERHALHLFHEAPMPVGGGTPGLPPGYRAPRAATKVVRAPEPNSNLTFCPTCQTAVPASGVCDYCD